MDNTTIIIILIGLAVVCAGIFYFLKNSGDDVKKIDPEAIEKTKKPAQPLRSNNAKTAQLESLRTKVAQTGKQPPAQSPVTKTPESGAIGNVARTGAKVAPSSEEIVTGKEEDGSDSMGASASAVAKKEVIMSAPVVNKEEASSGFINIVSKGADVGKDVKGRLEAQFPAQSELDEHSESQEVTRPTQAIIPTSPTKSGIEKQKPSILLVDDSKVIRVKTEKLLSSAGYQVTLAIDGIDALAKLETLHPDVIITDIEMPNLDGFGLVRSVKNNLQTSEIPVIVMTSHVNLHLDIAATEGINGFLPKPFTDKELFEQVSYLVGS